MLTVSRLLQGLLSYSVCDCRLCSFSQLMNAFVPISSLHTFWVCSFILYSVVIYHENWIKWMVMWKCVRQYDLRSGCMVQNASLYLSPRLLETLSVLPVAPECTNASWFPSLTQLLSEQLWQLPRYKDDVSQVDGTIGSYPTRDWL